MSSLYKRGNIWWMNFWQDEHHVQRSTRCTNKRDAAEYQRAYRTQIAKGEVGLEARKVIPVFSCAVKDFLLWSRLEHAAKPNTFKRYEIASKALSRFFRDAPLDRITKDDVERFKQTRAKATSPRTKRRLRPATINRELACLKILFNRAVKSDVIAKNPVSLVKFYNEDNEQVRVLSYDEERLYLLAASQPLQDVAVLMLETGARPDEVCRMKCADVDLARNTIFIQAGKTKAARRKINLTTRAREVLGRRTAPGGGEYLFAGGRGGTNTKHPVVKLNSAHNGAARRCGVAKFRLYDLRHTFATRTAQAGVDLVTLAALLGHSRLNMVMRYAHPVEEHKANAILKLESYREQQALIAAKG